VERQCFTVNVPPVTYAKQADYFGIASGRDVDKFAAAGLTPVKGGLVDAPYVDEFPLVLECKVLHTIEIGLHTQFIGEILDAETMEAAIAFAETGHLCLATLHSNNADQTIERILNFFPESAHKNVLMNLALNLRAVISQRLVKNKEGRRLPATEVLLNTPMIRDLLRRGQVHEIKAAMEASLEEGMESFDQCLFRLAKAGTIEQEEALRAADSRDGLALKFRLSEGSSGEHDPYADFSAGAPSITHGF